MMSEAFIKKKLKLQSFTTTPSSHVVGGQIREKKLARTLMTFSIQGVIIHTELSL